MSRFMGGGLVAKFIELCEERIETMNEALLSLIGDPDNVTARGALFQEVEALLGESGMLNLMEFRDLVVEVDAVLRWGNEQNFDVHPQFFEVAFEGVETLRTLVNAGIQDVPAAVSTSVVGYGTRTRAWLVNPPRPEPPPPPPPPEPEPSVEPELLPQQVTETQQQTQDPMRAQLVALFGSLAVKRISALRQLIMELQSLPRPEHIPKALREIESIRSESNILGLSSVSQVSGHIEMLMLWLSARHFQGPGQAFNGITVGLDLLEELIESGLGLDQTTLGDVEEYQLGVGEWIRENEAEPIPDAPAWASSTVETPKREEPPVNEESDAEAIVETFDADELPDEDTEDVMPDWLREPPTMEQDKVAPKHEIQDSSTEHMGMSASTWRPRFFEELASMQAQKHLETEEVADSGVARVFDDAPSLDSVDSPVVEETNALEEETQPFAVPEEWPVSNVSKGMEVGAFTEKSVESLPVEKDESVDDEPTSTPALDFLAEVESLFGSEETPLAVQEAPEEFVVSVLDTPMPTDETLSAEQNEAFAPVLVPPVEIPPLPEIRESAPIVDEIVDEPTFSDVVAVADEIVTFVAEAVAPHTPVVDQNTEQVVQISTDQMDDLVRLGGTLQVEQAQQDRDVEHLVSVAATLKEEMDALVHAVSKPEETEALEDVLQSIRHKHTELEQGLSGVQVAGRDGVQGVTVLQGELQRVHGLSAEEWFERHPESRFAVGHLLLVRSGLQVWGIPVTAVDEIVTVSHQEDPIESGPAMLLAHDGAEVPYHSLTDLIFPDQEDVAGGPVVVLTAEGKRWGIRVDTVVGQRQLVRQAPEPFLKGLTHLGGTAILDGDTVISILDARGLMEQASARDSEA